MTAHLAALRHYWRSHAAVAAGVAVATAVLTGALVVGDSVRASLRALAAERLGHIEYALTTPAYFRTRLAGELTTAVGRPVVPAIQARANLEHAKTGLRAAGVNLVGVDGEFSHTLFGVDGVPWSGLATGSERVVLNRALAAELGAAVGDSVLVRVGRWSAVPRGSLLGRKETAEVLKTLRLEVAGIVPDQGIGRFSLVLSQRQTLNAFVPRDTLAAAIAGPDLANTLLVGPATASPVADDPGDGIRLAAAVRATLTAEDLGLAIQRDANHLTVTSRELVLPNALTETVVDAAQSIKAPAQPVLTYLATTIALGDRQIPYATIAAVDPLAALPSLTLVDGLAAPPLGPEEIYLNEWAANDLGAKAGDSLQVEYFVVGAGEILTTEGTTLHVAGVVELRGLGADPTLTPDLPGIHGARNMADWDPPFPVDFRRIRDNDEDYWDAWRAAPRGFVAAATGRRLWSSRWGNTTAIRIAAIGEQSVAEVEAAVRQAIVAELDPATRGFAFEPVRARALAAATGATDFSVLFLSFSFFLIAAAMLLVSLLFSLGVEQRAGELGLLLAVGFRAWQVRARFVAEGLLVAVVGAIVGSAGALGYAWLMLAGLRTYWQPAVGTDQLSLAVAPGTLALGWLATVAIAGGTIASAVWRLSRTPLVPLLAGRPRAAPTASRGWRAIVVMLAALGIAFAGLIASRRAEADAVPLFFAVGLSLLVAGLAGFADWCGRVATSGAGATGRTTTILGLGIASAARNPGRSRLGVSLVACAAFVLVATAAARRETVTITDRDSPTGGFSLIAEADAPVYQPVDTPSGRFELGFSADDEAALTDTTILPLRLLPGDDTSCLNLYRPQRPRVLGVPPEFIERGGFEFARTIQPAENPWTLLDLPLADGVVPAIGDAETLQWILHLGLGDELTVDGDEGPVRLRIVGMLHASMFQSELLIGADPFSRHFPTHDGRSVFLIDAKGAAMPQVTAALERGLADYGVDVKTTAARLAGFQAVANTYISTFQTLGALGLLLGTFGLAVVLYRNVHERRGELATMRAFGFSRARLATMVNLENSLLLVVGLAVGSGSALVASWPSVREQATLPWRGFAIMLATILVVGIVVSATAANRALRAPLLPALKGD